jgi:DNA-binding GntR family transcriptional regulator
MKVKKRKPVVPEVAEQIRAAILRGDLIPGSKIAQDELAAHLKVSRLPIRQALLVLQREGLVLLDHNRGAVVAPLDIKFISDVFDCRAIVEEYVAAEVALRHNFDASELNEIVREGLESARSGKHRQDLVTRFHALLYEAVGNRLLIRIMGPLLDHVLRVSRFVEARKGSHHSDQRSPMNTWKEHAEIVDAITKKDVERARALSRSHLERVKQVTIAFLVSSAPLPPRPERRGKRQVPQISLDAFELNARSDSRLEPDAD